MTKQQKIFKIKTTNFRSKSESVKEGTLEELLKDYKNILQNAENHMSMKEEIKNQYESKIR